MFNSLWSNSFSLFDDFFDARPSLLPTFGFGPRLLTPRFMLPVMTWPNIEITMGETEAADEKHASSIPEDAGDEIKKAELAALKHQLKAAVKAEN